MTSINDLSKEIVRQLQLYNSEVENEIEIAKDEVAKEAVQELKNNSPKLTGSYSKGWRAKKVGSSTIIHNQTDYQLTHLLENGHAKSDGGRTEAKPHIRPAEEKVIDKFTKRVERAVSP